MLDEETIERIVEKVLRRLLAELAPPEGGPPRLTAEEASRARASLTEAAPWAPPVSPRPPRPPRPVAHRHPGRLLSEDDLVAYHRRGIRALALEPRCIVTPAARDRARDLQVDLVVGG